MSKAYDPVTASRRLKFIFDAKSGATPESGVEEYWGGDIAWITPEDLGKLKGRSVDSTRRHITEKGYRSCATSLAPVGSIALSKRAPIGQVAILGIEAACNQGCFLLTGRESVDERFFFYVLVNQRPLLEVLGRGSTFMELSTEDLRSLRLPYPSPVIQRQIANYLDCETGRIDGLIAEKESMLALIEEKRDALVSHVVTRGLDERAPLKVSGLEWVEQVPSHWVVCQLKRTWRSSDYGLSASIRDNGEIAVLRMSCIVDGRIDPTQAGRIDEVDERLLLRRDDLLFNRTNSLDQIAKVGLVDFDPEQPLTFASYLVRIRTNERATPQFLALLLNSSMFLAYARKNAIPAIGQANLSPTRYGEIHLPVPPLEEQDAIVGYLRHEAERIEPVRSSLLRSIQLLKDRRTSLIAEAVTGQIPLEEMTT